MAMSSDPPAEDIWSGIKQTMKILGIIAASFLAIIAIAVLAYKLAYPTYTYRYKITVEVEVDGQVRSGASVIEVRLVRQPEALGAPRVLPKVSGDAVFVDLGNGRNLIALLASGPAGMQVNFPTYVVPGHFNLSGNDKDLVKYPKLEGSWELWGDQFPTLITFIDLNDPRTAREVVPAQFETVFGAGIRFKRALSK